MKQIIKYKALDGQVFNTKKECIGYEKLLNKVSIIMKPFGELPKNDGCNFANGGGYLQHKPQEVEKAMKQITDLGNKLFNIKPPASFGWIGRYFDDSGNKCLYHAWGRLSNMDYQYREWGQGYYAANPNKGTQKQLN